MEPPSPTRSTARRLAIEVRGVVQGVGFRPFVYAAAQKWGLAGWVLNEADTVRIEVQGGQGALEAFCEALRSAHPPQARIDSLDVSETACQLDSSETFEIRSSTGEAPPRPVIPADLATCAECLAEIQSAKERRYAYPFTNCTNCGPRWSIIQALPYDRPRTSMAAFRMCSDCRTEYGDPTDRRFHAQPIACPKCGPQLQLLDPHGAEIAVRGEALEQAARAVVAGQILALKGLGGFQLVADATDAEAVARLRERKRRPHKPLAIMLASVDEARRRCEVSDREAAALSSHQAPILLLRRRERLDSTADVAEDVAPGNPYLGVMLPYTPLHHLLIAAIGRPIVCTSGNLSEEPMAVNSEEAALRLGAIADLFLVHNRPIVRPVDDSVARVTRGGLQLLRRARGYSPLPINLDFEAPTVLAVGGHLKNTVALSVGRQAIVGSHVGDLESALSVAVHEQAARDLVDFFQVAPEVIACDLHPDYASTRHAERLAAGWDIPLVRVQHHHAHVGACMAEHQLEGPVLGLAWDGTGYGPDGTVWGGEALECDAADFRRVAHLRTFCLPGGDQAVREPRRSGLGLLFEILAGEAAELARDWFTQPELATLMKLLGRSFRCPRTSSMGRLFDAVAVSCGLPAKISFEGQAAMALEFAADREERAAYPLPLSDTTPLEADWEPLIRAVQSDRDAGETVARISARFHNALADLAVAIAQRWGGAGVVLTGGCFQNALLTERVEARLLESDFKVYTHREVPPGDGGIALGQLWIAARRSEG
jgi:hydrogenase maturation protein HypF